MGSAKSGDLLAILFRPTMLACDLEQGRVAKEDVAKVEQAQSEACTVAAMLIEMIVDPNNPSSLELFGPREQKPRYLINRNRIFLHLRFLECLCWESMEERLIALGYNVNQKKIWKWNQRFMKELSALEERLQLPPEWGKEWEADAEETDEEQGEGEEAT